ncbi:ATP-binding protein [Streptomyces sp. NPDC006622]|uniref:ATP-binding protein n=1 Tax=Streptomyces sp. NPDC006622 TaxID=3155459 RepID=UPI0033B9A1E0
MPGTPEPAAAAPPVRSRHLRQQQRLQVVYRHDDTVAAAMIDRLVHHAEVISLKGDSYRMRGRDLGRVPAATTGK